MNPNLDPTGTPDPLDAQRTQWIPMAPATESIRAQRELIARLPPETLASMRALAGEELLEALSAPGDRYWLQERIGRGGHGEVFEAEQRSLGRVIAVKVLRGDVLGAIERESDRRAVVAAFRLEAITAAHLEHPNIVPVHDLGVGPDGLPQIAMKRVQGRPWNAVLKEEWDTLTPQEYLARHLPILVDVCEAVAFAHSRGVVHRDIKPSQVMVGDYGEVLLMDWGLAMFVGSGPRFEASPMMRYLPAWQQLCSNPSGTPALMAPEQTVRHTRGIGPWTDVYLLGSTLYFILTHTYPHEAENSAASMARAAAGEVEPPGRRIPGREMPPDLSALVMDALSPEHSRRPTTREFLDRLRGHLAGTGRRRESEALTAAVAESLARPAPGYAAFAEAQVKLADARALWPANPVVSPLHERTARAFAEAALGNGDLVLARLQAGRIADPARRQDLVDRVAAAEAHARRQASQRRIAMAAASVLLGLLIAGGVLHNRQQAEARSRAEAALERARRARGDAEELVSFMVGDLNKRLQPIGRIGVMSLVSERATAYFDRLAVEDRTEATDAYAVRARNQLLDVKLATGEVDRALELARRNLAEAKRVAARQPTRIEYQLLVTDALSRLAATLEANGDRAGYFAAIEENGKLTADLLRLAPDNAEAALDHARALSNVAYLRLSKRDFRGLAAVLDEAEAALLRYAALPEATEADRARLDSRLAHYRAYLFTHQERFEESIPHFERAREVATRLLAEAPESESVLVELATTLSELADVHLRLGNDPEGIAGLMDAVDTVEKYLRDNPSSHAARRELSVIYNKLGHLYSDYNDNAAAIGCYRRALAISEELLAREPANPRYLDDKAVAHYYIGMALHESGRREEALAEYLKDLDIQLAIERRAPDEELSRNIAISQGRIARLLLALGRRDEAERNAAEVVNRLSAMPQDDTGLIVHRLRARMVLGMAQLHRGAVAGARNLFEAVWADVRLTPSEETNSRLLAIAGAAALLAGCHEEAEPMLAELRRRNWMDEDLQGVLLSCGYPPW